MSEHIVNRWSGYTLADCACEYCLYYGGKKKGCQLEECCCAEEIKEAREREGRNKAGAAENRGPSSFSEERM